MGRAIEPAEAEGGEAVDLGECPGHHDVLAAGHQRLTAVIIVAGHKLSIGGVYNQQGLGRQAGGQTVNLLRVQARAGGVVRVGQEHEARLVGAGGQKVVDVWRQIGVWRGDGRAAVCLRGEPVEGKTVVGKQHLLPLTGIGHAEKGDKLVRAVAAQDPRRVDVMPGADGGAQVGAVRAGISRQIIASRLVGGDGGRAGAEGVFVGGELDDPVHAFDMAGPADIGRNAHDPGLRGDLGRIVCRIVGHFACLPLLSEVV